MGWKDVKLGEICSAQNGYAFKSSDFLEDGDMNVIKIKEVKENGVLFSKDTSKVAFDEKLSRFLVKSNDVVFALTGDPISRPNPLSWVGRVAKYRHRQPAVLNQRVCRVDCTEAIDSDYLFYYFKQDNVLYSLASTAKGSASQANISTKDILDINIALPPLFLQRRIANILSSLDRKIELNNKINAQLEEMAQTLFKHWLLECKEDITIGELSYNINDYSKCRNPKVVLVNSSDVTEGFFDHHNYTENKDLKGHFKKRFQKGDILYSQVRPRNRHWAYCDFYADDYIASTQLMIIRNREEIIPSIVLYHYIVSDDVWKEFTSRTETRSGTFPQGNYEEISTIKVPFGAEMKDISINLEVIHSKMYNNNQENIKLASLRDTLLPKLMSGEINLEDYGGE